ncbi:MAG TPA: tetratricopeptide repeat protein [Pyrinomonadaceae bacterium]|nr:tetratricopeptide repeat protein [Pyrinomonadaceae bacterium]
MYRLFISLTFLCLCCSSILGQQLCLQRAEEIAPPLTRETRRDFEAKLTEARKNAETDPSADSLIWLGRRIAYLGHYKKAIEVFTQGAEKFPDDARFLRHRGHRFITLRCFDLAIEDFNRAVKLVKGKPDQIEPDGLPNARNIPTSTLQSNIWYHLGLAHYLKGDFKAALKAYREAEKVSTNPDMLVATTNWLYMTLRRLGREKEAEKVVATIKPDLDVIENADYYNLIRLYQGKATADELLKEISGAGNALSKVSIGYGLGNWFLYNKRRDEAEKIFRQIILGNQWASFGHIAAEAELTR